MMLKLIVIVSVFVAACAQMLLKKGASIKYKSFIRQYLNVWVIGGYGILLVSLLVNIFAMSRGVMAKEVSIIESMSYLFVPVLSFLFFKEKLTRKRVGAVCLIIMGIIVFFV